MAQSCTVVSPNNISRAGLCRVIADEGFDEVRVAASAQEIDWSLDLQDHLLLIDLPSQEGEQEIMSLIKERGASCRVLILADTFCFDGMMACFRAGANGYLTKDMASTSLIASLKLATMGERVMPSSLVDLLLEQGTSLAAVQSAGSSAEDVNLSQREMDVLNCLMAGYQNKVIARRLDVTEATVKVHVKAILRKLKVGNRTQAAMWASSHGFASESASAAHIH